MPKTKPRIAIVSLTSCEGCQFVLLDQGKRFLDLLKKVSLDEFRLIEDDPELSGEYDLCLVEGNPVTKQNIKLLQAMRKKSKLLVVLGNCASLGGVWELKNYGLKKKTISHVYRHNLKVENPAIKEVSNFVKVDFTIPGCPVSGEELMEFLHLLAQGRIPKIPQNPVCHECQNLGYDCLLQKGEICLGPITLGGCQAVCLKSRQACWGCRGLLEGAQVSNLISHLRRNFTDQQISRVMEVFGLKDDIVNNLIIKNSEGGRKK